MDKFLTLVLAAYCFVVQFGTLFRYGSSEIALGVSTLLALLILLLGVNKIPGQIRQSTVFSWLAVLFGWFVLSSYLSPTGYLAAYYRLAQLILYLAMAAAVCSWGCTEKRLRAITLSVAIGLLISSGLTIIDYKGWVNVPRCNEFVAGDFMEEGSGSYVMQAGGFFPRRTAMAAFFSLSAAMSLIMALTTRGWLGKSIYGAAGVCGILAILLSHNRSGVLSIIAGVGAYLLFTKSISFNKRLKVISVSTVLGMGILVVAFTYFPDHVEVYKRKLPFLFPESSDHYSDSQSSSDSVRWQNLESAFKSIASNPVGNGLGNVYNPERGYMNAHNSFTSLLWAGGAITLLWVIPFSISAFKLLFVNVNVPPNTAHYFDAFRFAMVGFFLHNMAHDSLGTGIFWIFLAAVISIRQQEQQSLNTMQVYRYYPMAGHQF
ncbi:MAG: O-antigen ligase family protein [Planctomycetales bacterium]|nr:O-antigen ligase family protein [Planctomycetales bacterium]